jgi:hypothetical protein
MSTPLRWRCAAGHEWEATAGHVIHSESWCPFCVVRASLMEMRRLATAQQGRCLSDAVEKTREPLRWECKVGHRFERTPMAARQGLWCPECR